MKRTLGILCFTVLLLINMQTQSFAITDTLSYNGPVLMSYQTGNIDVQFDISNILSQGIITSVNYSFSFSDNSDTLLPVGGSATTYQQVGNDYYRDFTRNFMDPYESVLILMGVQLINLAVTPYFDNTPVFVGQHLDMQDPYTYYIEVSPGVWIPQIGFHNYYSNMYDHIFGNTGDVTVTGSLDPTSLNGILSFTLQPAGDIIFDGAGLTIEVNPVPEPTTMLLLALGLVGLTGVRRKFQK